MNDERFPADSYNSQPKYLTRALLHTNLKVNNYIRRHMEGWTKINRQTDQQVLTPFRSCYCYIKENSSKMKMCWLEYVYNHNTSRPTRRKEIGMIYHSLLNFLHWDGLIELNYRYTNESLLEKTISVYRHRKFSTKRKSRKGRTTLFTTLRIIPTVGTIVLADLKSRPGMRNAFGNIKI